ncbi:MAG: G5 domain-containing protein, partial [Parascardovia denticolens]
SKVTEATQIIISSTNSEIQTVEQSIPFNTIKKNDPTLAQGTTKVQTEGKEGTMEITNLVTKNGTKTLSSNTISEYVKTVPTNKVILVGTKQPEAPKVSTNSNSNSSSSGSNSAPKASSNNYGTTLAQGDYQSYAHSQVLARKWGEDQFTCLVFLWQRESGWRVNAANPSGAYGIPQALPGSKMGPGWQTDAKVQIDWGLSYIAGRYGTPCGAWGHSNATGWY